MQAPYSSFSSGSVTLRVTNPCGTTNTPAVKSVSESYGCSGGGLYSLDAYPNPSNELLNISINQSQTDKNKSVNEDNTKSIEEFDIKLW